MSRTPAQKGQSGNPKGRPEIPKEVKEAAKAHTMAAIDMLLKLIAEARHD